MLFRSDPVVHSSNADVLANFPLVLTDANGITTPATLGITITDSKPVAVVDTNTITEDQMMTFEDDIMENYQP